MLQLNIAKAIKKICEENEIDYFLNAGSLLGAIRHGGFIPWDDDLDIGMTRKNFEKFIKIASSNLDEKYFLQTWDTDKKFAMPFAKIRLNGTKYIEYNSRNVDIHNGIYVDIFPYDNIPECKFLQLVQKYKSKYYIHLLLNKSQYDYIEKNNTIKILFGIILKILSRFYSYEKLHTKLQNCMNKYNEVQCSKVVTFGGASSFEKETLLFNWIKETIDRKFEDEYFRIPKEWEKYLIHFYGDYMTPPPVEKRYEGHNIVECDLGIK